MPYQGDSSEKFRGASGQLAVMGELLHRNCNAAIPLVDIGTDVFAFHDNREVVARIQVKTATGNPYKSKEGYFAVLGVPTKQLNRVDNPPLFYALAVRLNDGWGSFIVISRSRLKELSENGCDRVNNKGDLVLRIQFRPETNGEDVEVEKVQKLTAFCRAVDLTSYLNAWESLPPLQPLAPIDEQAGGGDADGNGAAADAAIEENDLELPQA